MDSSKNQGGTNSVPVSVNSQPADTANTTPALSNVEQEGSMSTLTKVLIGCGIATLVIAILVGAGVFILGKNAMNFLKKSADNVTTEVDNSGTVYSVEANKLTREENVGQIRENLTEFLNAQKAQDTAKMSPLIEKDEGLSSDYLASYFQNSQEKINSFQIANVDFLTGVESYANYPRANKAIAEIIIDRATVYGGAQSESLKITMLYDGIWKVVVTEELIPRKLEAIQVSAKPLTISAEKEAVGPAFTAFFKLSFSNVAVFKNKILISGTGEITEKSLRYMSIYELKIQDNQGNNFLSQGSKVKSGLTGNFYEVLTYNPPKEIANGIDAISYSFGVKGLNIPDIGEHDYGKQVLTIKF